MLNYICCSNENVEHVVPRSVGGLEGLVSVLDQPPHLRPGVSGVKGASGAGDSGSTPGTATAPLSSHSSAHSSGGGTVVTASAITFVIDPFWLKEVMAFGIYVLSGNCRLAQLLYDGVCPPSQPQIDCFGFKLSLSSFPPVSDGYKLSNNRNERSQPSCSFPERLCWLICVHT